MLRKEELTVAPTPDKFDRSLKDKNDHKPYPLTEEEATPNTPLSQKKPTECLENEFTLTIHPL
jgi:hypothetical protein